MTTFVRETTVLIHHIVALITILFIYYIIRSCHYLYYLFNLLLYDVRSFMMFGKNDTG